MKPVENETTVLNGQEISNGAETATNAAPDGNANAFSDPDFVVPSASKFDGTVKGKSLARKQTASKPKTPKSNKKRKQLKKNAIKHDKPLVNKNGKHFKSTKSAVVPKSFDSFTDYYVAPNNALAPPPQPSPGKLFPSTCYSVNRSSGSSTNKNWMFSPRHLFVSSSPSVKRSRFFSSASPMKKLSSSMSALFLLQRITEEQKQIIDTGGNDARFYPDLSHNEDDDGLLLA